MLKSGLGQFGYYYYYCYYYYYHYHYHYYHYHYHYYYYYYYYYYCYYHCYCYYYYYFYYYYYHYYCSKCGWPWTMESTESICVLVYRLPPILTVRQCLNLANTDIITINMSPCLYLGEDMTVQG